MHRPRTLYRADADAWAAAELAGHAEVEIDDGKEKRQNTGRWAFTRMSELQRKGPKDM